MSLSAIIVLVLGVVGLSDFMDSHPDYPKLIEPVFWTTSVLYLFSSLRKGGH